MPSVCNASECSSWQHLCRTFAATTASSSNALFEWRAFLLQGQQRPPGAGCKISVRKLGMMACTSGTVLNTCKIRRHYSFSTNSSYQEKKRNIWIRQVKWREVVPPSQSAHIALSLTAKTALVPGLDHFPAPWAAELSHAAPTPHISHVNEPHPRGKASPHQHQQLNIPANICSFLAALAMSECSHLPGTITSPPPPPTSTTSPEQSHEHRGKKINPWRYFRAQRNHTQGELIHLLYP